MALIDPLVSLQTALLTHLDSTVALSGHTLRTRRGWPEHNADLSLSTGPLLVTVVGEDRQIPTNPRSLGQTDADETLYKVAERTVPLQLHVFAAYRAILDDLIVQVNVGLSNRLPSSPDLWLTSADYYDRPLTFSRQRLRRQDEDAAAATGEWEAVWSLTCRSDVVLTATHATLQSLTLRLTDTGDGSSEDTICIP